MIGLSVSKNGAELCVAGHTDAEMLTSSVSGVAAGEDAMSLNVAGMCELPGERVAHLRWIDFSPLKSGDLLLFKLVDSEGPTPSSVVLPTDSPEYLAEQAEFRKVEAEWEAPLEEPPIQWPNIQIVFKINDGTPLRVKIPAGQAHFLCSLLWTKWDPEDCRVFARTFSGAALGVAKRQTNWLRATLKPGDVLSMRVNF